MIPMPLVNSEKGVEKILQYTPEIDQGKFYKLFYFLQERKNNIFFPKKFISHHPRTMTWDVWIKLCAVIFCVTQFDEKFVRLAQVIAEIHLYFNNTIDIEWALKYRAERLFFMLY